MLDEREHLRVTLTDVVGRIYALRKRIHCLSQSSLSSIASSTTSVLSSNASLYDTFDPLDYRQCMWDM